MFIIYVSDVLIVVSPPGLPRFGARVRGKSNRLYYMSIQVVGLCSLCSTYCGKIQNNSCYWVYFIWIEISEFGRAGRRRRTVADSMIGYPLAPRYQKKLSAANHSARNCSSSSFLPIRMSEFWNFDSNKIHSLTDFLHWALNIKLRLSRLLSLCVILTQAFRAYTNVMGIWQKSCFFYSVQILKCFPCFKTTPFSILQGLISMTKSSAFKPCLTCQMIPIYFY